MKNLMEGSEDEVKSKLIEHLNKMDQKYTSILVKAAKIQNV